MSTPREPKDVAATAGYHAAHPDVVAFLRLARCRACSLKLENPPDALRALTGAGRILTPDR